MRYAIFLRGVNVGGVKVPSAELRTVLSGLGLGDVKTYLASGNVTCTADGNATTLKERVERALTEAFSYDAKVVVLAHDELAAVVAGYPFATDPEHHRYAVLCDSDETAAELAAAAGGEEVAAHGSTLYWRCVIGSTLDTPFSKVLGARRYRAVTTNRNLNTVEKML